MPSPELELEQDGKLAIEYGGDHLHILLEIPTHEIHAQN